MATIDQETFPDSSQLVKDSSHCFNSGQTKVLHGHVNSSSQSVISLKCSFINVCGLTLKVLIADFLEFLSDVCGLTLKVLIADCLEFLSDICRIAKTKLDKVDGFRVPGYTCICFNCEKCCCFKSGGVGGIIKDALFDKVTILFDYSSENFLFFKLNDVEIIFSAVYIPSESSNYSD